MMRIITGKARGVRLATLDGSETRPTAERVKEAVFSALQFEIEGKRVLDLFAGSGQLGLEAYSRGASKVVLVDASKAAANIVSENMRRVRAGETVVLHCMDSIGFLETYRGEPFGLVFLDPPYAAGMIPTCLSLLLSRGLLEKDARVVCEAKAAEDVFGKDAETEEHYQVLKENRYGAAFVKILTVKEALK